MKTLEQSLEEECKKKSIIVKRRPKAPEGDQTNMKNKVLLDTIGVEN